MVHTFRAGGSRSKTEFIGLPAGEREPNLSLGCFSAASHSRVRARKPNSLALPVGGREPNLSPGCFSASSSSRVRARKPNSLALPASRREPNLSPGRFSASSRSRVRARKPNSLALPVGGREPNLSPNCFSASSRSRVRAQKPNLLGLPADEREPNRSPGCFSVSSRSRVRARKPNSLGLPAGEREPDLSPGCFSVSSRSRVCARKPNLLALPAGGREPNQNMGCFSASSRSRVRARITAPLLAWSDEGSRACGEQGANREGRAPGKWRLCWRGPTKKQGLAGSKAPTWKAARWGNGAYVGVVRRRSKGLRGARRQQESPRARITAPMLAWSDEEARVCGEQGANRKARALGKRRLCWRSLTKAQGFSGSKAPTRKPARSESGIEKELPPQLFSSC